MAGIRIKVERAQRRKHTTKETGVWQTFFSFPFVVKRMEWKVWSYEKIERERLPIRGSIFSPVRLHADFLLTSLHERRSSGLWWPVRDSYKDENELFIILRVLIHLLFVLRLKVTYVQTIFNVNFQEGENGTLWFPLTNWLVKDVHYTPTNKTALFLAPASTEWRSSNNTSSASPAFGLGSTRVLFFIYLSTKQEVKASD